MKEIEVLYELCESVTTAGQKLDGYNFEGKQQMTDVYMTQAANGQLRPDENGRLSSSFRLRKKGDKTYVTYKDDVFENDEWQYSDEYEMAVEDFETAQQIFRRLGFQVLVVVQNVKSIFSNGSTEIVLEEVADLGNFIEIEHKAEDDVDPKQTKQMLRDTISSLGIVIGEELNAGKPELLLKKSLEDSNTSPM